MTELAQARGAAAELLAEQGYAAEASIVARGEGDDFAEVRMALALLRILARRGEGSVPKRLGRRLVGEEC